MNIKPEDLLSIMLQKDIAILNLAREIEQLKQEKEKENDK